MTMGAVIMVVATVGLGRAALELILAKAPSAYEPIEIVNSVAFYLEAFSLYGLVASLSTGYSLHRVSGIVVVGVFLGLFPPIIDAFVLGPGQGYYWYFQAPISEWQPSLFDERFASVGEGITLWLTVLVTSVYVWEVSRSAWRSVVAGAAAYVAIVILAFVPMLVVKEVYPALQRAWGGTREARATVVVITQLVVAQVAYLCARPGVGKRVLTRLLHVGPFVALVILGAQVRRAEEHLAELLLSDPLPVVMSTVGILQMGIVNIVQNDAYEAQNGDRTSRIVSGDAEFFTTVGALYAGAFALVMDRVGLLLGLCLLGSVVYNSPRYAAKRRFPANHKLEGLWAWCAYCLGGYAHPNLSAAAQPLFAGVSFLIFGGWSVFSGLKDYKDIRADYKAQNQTIYTLALRRGIPLRKVHRWLLVGLGVGSVTLCGVLATSMSSLSWTVAGLAAAGGLVFTACGPPVRRTVFRFLLALSLFMGILAYGMEGGSR